jgi:DNA polymerase III epsilon subunit-like protein
MAAGIIRRRYTDFEYVDPQRFLCTLNFLNDAFYGRRLALANACAFFNIKVSGMHRAFNDVLANVELYRAL